LAVHPDFQRKGVGRRLLLCGLDHLQGQGRCTCFLEVRASNRIAQALYSACGFLVSGKRPGYYRSPPEDAVIMRKVL
jgi:ribosomal-protein-alanine N-acetyltransferase